MDASVCCKRQQSKPILINIPSLPQSTTKEREYSETTSIVTLQTPTGGYITNEDTDYDDDDDTSSSSRSDTYRTRDYTVDDDSSSSSSSDWEPSTSMASSYLPRDHKKSNNKSALTPYISIRMEDDECVTTLNRINIMNHVLFYPHSNLQSLLFSSPHCYIQTDYKKMKNVHINEEHDANDISTTDMDWNDAPSVQKLKDLIHNLLVSANLTVGIREEEIYLMFCSPSPQEIIEQMRFGMLSDLCDVHMDRFGRRSFYRKGIDSIHRKNKHSINNHTYFYTHTHIPSKLFATNDIHHLSNFVGDSPKHQQSPRHLSPRKAKLTSPGRKSRKKSHIKKTSEDKLEWKNIDCKPVTHLLTKTKTITFNLAPNRTATNIASKHKKKKTNHKVKKVALSALQENVHRSGIMYKATDTKAVNNAPHKKVQKKMSVEDFKSVNVARDIFVSGVADEQLSDNYAIAKKVAHYFDAQFGDTDTVCLVADNNKQPAISYWTKGQFVRKDKNAFNTKYILVYRAYKHTAATQPIVSAEAFEEYVKDLSFQYENEKVDFIGRKLDEKFGDGCHFVRSTQKKHERCDFDVYCRYSNKYECAFKLDGITHDSYIIAWRR